MRYIFFFLTLLFHYSPLCLQPWHGLFKLNDFFFLLPLRFFFALVLSLVPSAHSFVLVFGPFWLFFLRTSLLFSLFLPLPSRDRFFSFFFYLFCVSGPFSNFLPFSPLLRLILHAFFFRPPFVDCFFQLFYSFPFQRLCGPPGSCFWAFPLGLPPLFLTLFLVCPVGFPRVGLWKPPHPCPFLLIACPLFPPRVPRFGPTPPPRSIFWWPLVFICHTKYFFPREAFLEDLVFLPSVTRFLGAFASLCFCFLFPRRVSQNCGTCILRGHLAPTGPFLFLSLFFDTPFCITPNARSGAKRNFPQHLCPPLSPPCVFLLLTCFFLRSPVVAEVLLLLFGFLSPFSPPWRVFFPPPSGL